MDISVKHRLQNSLAYCAEREYQQSLVVGYVYVIQADKFVKIGIAKDVIQRLNMMQIGNPHQLKLLHSWGTVTPKAIEEEIHCEYRRFHVRGEWFKIPEPHLSKLLNSRRK